MTKDNLTKDEAIKALRAGHILTHRLMGEGEWVKQVRPTQYEFEDGVNVAPRDFWHLRFTSGWLTGWSIVDGKIH